VKYEVLKSDVRKRKLQRPLQEDTALLLRCIRNHAKNKQSQLAHLGRLPANSVVVSLLGWITPFLSSVDQHVAAPTRSQGCCLYRFLF